MPGSETRLLVRKGCVMRSRSSNSQIAVLLLCVLPPTAAEAAPWWHSNKLNGAYTATAYAQSGITASSQYTHRHIAAADTDLLPLGTRIRISNAGKYSGEYVVADTGSKIHGRKLDIYIPSESAAKEFGVKSVRVRVIKLGDGTKEGTKQADKEVKAAVANDVARKVEGGAATEQDLAKPAAPPK